MMFAGVRNAGGNGKMAANHENSHSAACDVAAVYDRKVLSLACQFAARLVFRCVTASFGLGLLVGEDLGVAPGLPGKQDKVPVAAHR